MFDDRDLILCDLDGCLIAGGRVLAGAADFCDRFADRLVVFSNNSSDTGETLAARLGALGLRVDPANILLAGTGAVAALAARAPGASVLLRGSPAVRARAQAAGLRLDDPEPAYVLLTRDESFDYAALQAVVRAVHRGAHLIAANGDRTHPGADGTPVPETGALLAAVRTCLPDAPVEIFGKPSAGLYDLAQARAGTPKARMVAIGDNPDTDLAGAIRFGIDGILIGRHPDARYPDLAALLADT